MLKTSIIAITVAAAGAALAVSASAASALPLPHPAPGPAPTPAPVTAVTHLSDRPDSGSSGDWADDTFTRVLSITQTGGSAGAYTFSAKLADTGTFKAIKGAQTPNQGPGYAGDVVKSSVIGPMTGYADFTFTASELPATAPNAGVPAGVNDHNVAPSGVTLGTDADTSNWYELAFPAGTTFPSGGIGAWSWKYDATVKTVTFRTVWVLVREHHRWVWVKETVPVAHDTHQQWIDASSNGAGDLAGDGNIQG